ncbi:DUF930 domain-containing protein [Rhizobium sp. YIM 134829]|uniref:DUF930 domain-containing protein n=1 Tax=Rhizobium sp. YIM 134829 TaxID=3390453 RepID=UPI0039790B5F
MRQIGEGRERSGLGLAASAVYLALTMSDAAPPFKRFVLALAASLAIHVLVVAPFFFSLPEAPAAPVEDSVPVELVPPPEAPPAPEKPHATEPVAEKPASPPPEKPSESEGKPPVDTAASPTATGAPLPFEASAPEAPDQPPPDEAAKPPGDGAPAPEVETAEQEPAPQPEGKPLNSQDAAAKTPPVDPVPDQPPSSTPPDRPSQAEAPPIDAARAPQGEPSPLQASSPPTVSAPADETVGSPAAPIEVLSARGDASGVANPAPGSPAPAPPSTDPASMAEDPAGDRQMSADEVAAYVPARPVAPQVKPPAPDEAIGVPPMRKVETLYAKDMLTDPRVRGALSKLPPGRRMVQICSIEVLEQVRRAGFTPDMLASPADGGVEQGPTRLATRGGAVRSRGVWREIAYDCRVDTEATTITDLRFSLGAVVPRSQWAARKLNVD